MLERTETVKERMGEDAIPIQPVAKHGHFQAWQTICAPFCSVQGLNSARMQRYNDVSVSNVGPIGLLRGACGGQLVRRSSAKVSETPGFVLVTCYDTGRLTGIMGGVPFDGRGNDLILRDLDHPFEALRYPSRFKSLLIPRRMLGLEVGEAPSLRILCGDDPIAQAVRAIVSEAFEALSANSQVYSYELMQRLLATVRTAMLQPRRRFSPRRAARQAQLIEIRTFVEENLERLDLSAETLLPEFGLSRATLYRLFEAQGGVRSYIVDRRLFRALLEISDMPRRRGKIQRAAKRWGFSSPSNFNRSVQHVFGTSPGALLRVPSAPALT